VKRRPDPEIAAQQARDAAAAKAASIERIAALTSRVPPKVLGGGAQMADEWKTSAVRARSLAARQRVSAGQLRDAVTIMEQYE
jgi:hypothetical protein